jgi:hypothetical protein
MTSRRTILMRIFGDSQTSEAAPHAAPFDGNLFMIWHDRPATRLAFLVAGFGIACWAPLAPFAKQCLAVDDATLGVLLFCIGIGSLAAMQLTGAFSARYGSKAATPS